MHTYRFKFTFEDQTEFVREFEIRSGQTFEDFHFAIVENLGLDKSMLSSFFITDNRFRKKREISLIDMNSDERPDDLGENPGEKMLVMKDAHINDFIEDPHQKMIYVYDYLNYFTFYLELIKIDKTKSGQSYPRVVKTIGDVPKELTSKVHQLSSPDLGQELGFDDDLVDPEDLKSLEDTEFLDEEEAGSFDDFGEDKY
ncbi:MAG TPA: hypothetical protein VLH61_02130 [Bacteroidales bacterium]|nr:hypothetical protein [Bacteroidales bacterium]